MKHVVVGGGIAGVCCVEQLCSLRPEDEVTLISSSTVLKGVDTVIKITKTIEEVLVTEKDLASLRYPNLRVLQAAVSAIDTVHKEVHLQSEGCLKYDRLCIAAGARPKVLGFKHERIITLRGTQSVQDFAKQLGTARRIAVVGNGGIALELIGAVRDVEVVWVLKHGHIGDAFFDVDAAEFLLAELQHQQLTQQTDNKELQQQQQQQDHGQHTGQMLPPPQQPQQPQQQLGQQQHYDQQSQQQQPVHGGHEQTGEEIQGEVAQAAAAYSTAPDGVQQGTAASSSSAATSAGSSTTTAAAAAAMRGHAAGPKWVDQLPGGKLPANVRLERNALVVYAGSEPPPPLPQQQQPGSAHSGVAAAAEEGSTWPLYMQLSSGEGVGVDLLVQAIGVEPSTDWLPADLARAPDGGILVDADLESSVPGIFAAGDCCTVDPAATAPHWFQMRLWTQARVMGCHAAVCMAGAKDADWLSFSFELFTHVTRFLGKKVVLLGLYNGQKLQHEPEQDVVMYTRALDEGMPGATFVRVLLLRGKMQGAVLIGETDLEETFENLILDGLDLSQFGPGLLDPDIELDHVFD